MLLKKIITKCGLKVSDGKNLSKSDINTNRIERRLLMSGFIEEVLKLMNIQLNRIETCLNKLSEEDIWKKVKNNTNSIGNLCIHLAGNEYQHFISGIGKQPFIRE